MSGPVGRGAKLGTMAGAILFTAWSYYDVVANHKNMFGFAPVFAAPFLGGLFGAVFGAFAGVVTQSNRQRRADQDQTK